MEAAGHWCQMPLAHWLLHQNPNPTARHMKLFASALQAVLKVKPGKSTSKRPNLLMTAGIGVAERDEKKEHLYSLMGELLCKRCQMLADVSALRLRKSYKCCNMSAPPQADVVYYSLARRYVHQERHPEHRGEHREPRGVHHGTQPLQV